MINYIVGRITQTFGTVVITGMIASTAMAMPLSESQHVQKSAKELSTYHQLIAGISSTQDTRKGTLNHLAISTPPLKLENVVTDLYAKLVAEQEDLGPEFEKILFANLWDLYQS